jgi:mono/diheme cytochrome c family protein
MILPFGSRPGNSVQFSIMEQGARCVMLTLGLAGWAGWVWAQGTVEVVSQPNIEQGQAIYQAHCEECHGPAGHGDGPRAALLAPRPGNLVSAATSSKTDEELFAMISRGVPRTSMRSWEKVLSEDDRKNVLAYIRSLVHFQDSTQTPPPP